MHHSSLLRWRISSILHGILHLMYAWNKYASKDTHLSYVSIHIHYTYTYIYIIYYIYYIYIYIYTYIYTHTYTHTHTHTHTYICVCVCVYVCVCVCYRRRLVLWDVIQAWTFSHGVIFRPSGLVFSIRNRKETAVSIASSTQDQDQNHWHRISRMEVRDYLLT